MKNTLEQELVLAPEEGLTNFGNDATIISEEAQTYSTAAVSTYAAGGSSMATATRLTLGRWKTAEICCPDDAHWYWFTANNTTVQSDGTINWYRIHAGGSVDTIGRLYDASGNQIKYSNDDDGFNFNMTLQLTHGAKYYLCVTTDSNDTGVYDVRVTAIASPATSGDCCDDCLSEDLSSATTLSLNTWQSGSITTAGTAVYYRFVPSSTAWYTIHSSGSIDTMGYLLDANGNQLDTDDDDGATGRNFRMVYRLTAGQTYYLKVKGYGSATGSFSVAVTNTVYVQTVEVIPERMTLTKGNTHTLSANLYPVYATNKTHTWSSSNTNVATVTSGGVVTAKSGGSATIYATAQDGSGKNGFCLVTVPVPVSSVTVCPAEATMYVGETYTPTAIVYPDDATNKTVTWCSSNPEVAEVNASTGRITAKMAGIVVVTATTNDGCYTASCELWIKGKTPVFLIHGRTGHSKSTWGINTNIPSGQNNHFDSNIDAELSNGMRYTDRMAQFIDSFEPNNGESDTDNPCNLGNELLGAGYEKNINLFAFNYPNKDAVKYSAQKFEAYINNLISYVRTSGNNEMKVCFYASRSDYNNNNYKISIVGHSMGGLVARYYIENLGQDNRVDKLITICTPHWGSGYGDLSNYLGTDFHVLCDHDLDFDSAMFGGDLSTSLECNAIGANCYNGSYTLTDELLYDKVRNTKYYAIAGIDYPGGPVFQNDYCFEMSSNYTTYQQITDFMVEKQVYRYEPSDFNPKNVGDNMVGFMSQIGWTKNSGNTSDKKIQMEKIFIDVDTNGGNGGGVFIWEILPDGSNIFHSKVNHRHPVCVKVIEYLEEP